MKTILIIEDQPDMRENIATILEVEQIAVLAASNGKDGVHIAREEKPVTGKKQILRPTVEQETCSSNLPRSATMGTVCLPIAATERTGKRIGVGRVHFAGSSAGRTTKSPATATNRAVGIL